MECGATFPTPYGPGCVVVSGGRLAEVRLPYLDERTGRPVGRDDGPGPEKIASCPPEHPDHDVAAFWSREITAFFEGGRRQWSAEDLDLDARGFTPFQTDVYRALVTVPPGAVVSYGELARMAGRPGAARAVGTAMAANPIAIVVPCHRVVLSGGRLGRYGFGRQWKHLLLELESGDA